MATLTLTAHSAPNERLDLSALTAVAFSAASTADIARVAIGTAKRPITIGDVFRIDGEVGGDRLVIAGATSRMDGIGTGLAGGTVIIEGDAGSSAAHGMKSGRLEIKGSAGNRLAAGMSGGVVTVGGSAGDEVGSAATGERFGMSGGIVSVAGDIGNRPGDRMRRGTIIAKGRVGAQAGSRMMGGTIWTETGFGVDPGPLLRRGSLIGPKVERLLPTFADCGFHDLLIARILHRYLSGELGPLAPKALPLKVRRLAGDLATIGKGELLLTA